MYRSIPLKNARRLALALVCSLLLGSPCAQAQTAGTVVNSIQGQFPIAYSFSLPRLDYRFWDADYNFYNRYLTREVMKTQMGLDFVKDSIHIWWCVPAARTHVQLDTATTILNPQEIEGEWEMISSRTIRFIDSAVYANKTIYRDTTLLYEPKNTEGKLILTDNHFKLYGKDSSRENFKKVAGRKYELVNGRMLMLYKLSKAGAAIWFVGLNRTDGYLILNSHAVEERKRPGIYIAYQSVVQQLIFRKKT